MRDAPPLLAPSGRLPPGLSPPCSLSTSTRTCAGLRNSSRPLALPQPAHSDPNLAPPPAPLESIWDRPLLVLALRGSHRSGPTGLAPSTSPICSTSRAESTLTRSTRRCLPCSVGFPRAPCLLRPGGSHARGSAGNERKMANRAPSRWASFYAQPTPNVSSTLPRCVCAPRLCTCISGVSTCRELAVPLAGHDRTPPAQRHTGAARGRRPGPRQHVRQRRVAPPSVPPCALTSPRPPPGRVAAPVGLRHHSALWSCLFH